MESNLRAVAWAGGPLGTFRELAASNESDFKSSVHLKKYMRSPGSIRCADIYLKKTLVYTSTLVLIFL